MYKDYYRDVFILGVAIDCQYCNDELVLGPLYNPDVEGGFRILIAIDEVKHAGAGICHRNPKSVFHRRFLGSFHSRPKSIS